LKNIQNFFQTVLKLGFTEQWARKNFRKTRLQLNRFFSEKKNQEIYDFKNTVTSNIVFDCHMLEIISENTFHNKMHFISEKKIRNRKIKKFLKLFQKNSTPGTHHATYMS